MTSFYAKQWDRHVERFDREGWPGDQWGTPSDWEHVFQGLFVGVEDWRRAVEIGPGSGKYTLKVLEASEATVRGYDVSARFLEVCRRRLSESVDAGRLSLHLLDGIHSGQMLADLEACGWRRELDALYSIDTLVHVDLTYMMAYLVTAATALRKGGKLILTLANATSESGFNRLLAEMGNHFSNQAVPAIGKYEWVSPDMVESILGRLGFEIDEMSEFGNLRVRASLARPDDSFAEHLRM